jgi:hypothetical protein
MKFLLITSWCKIFAKEKVMNELLEKDELNLSLQRKINTCYFQIDIDLKDLSSQSQETLFDANELYRFRNTNNACKLKLTALNQEAQDSQDSYDTFDEVRVYSSLIKDERDEGYYHLDLMKNGKIQWQFRLRSLEVTNLIKHPVELGV